MDPGRPTPFCRRSSSDISSGSFGTHISSSPPSGIERGRPAQGQSDTNSRISFPSWDDSRGAPNRLESLSVAAPLSLAGAARSGSYQQQRSSYDHSLPLSPSLRINIETPALKGRGFPVVFNSTGPRCQFQSPPEVLPNRGEWVRSHPDERGVEPRSLSEDSEGHAEPDAELQTLGASSFPRCRRFGNNSVPVASSLDDLPTIDSSATTCGDGPATAQWLAAIAEESSFPGSADKFSHVKRDRRKASGDKSAKPAQSTQSTSAFTRGYKAFTQLDSKFPLTPFRRSIPELQKFGLYSINTPLVDRKHKTKRWLYACAAMIKGAFAIPIITTFSLIIARLESPYITSADILFLVSTGVVCFQLIVGGVLDLLVFFRAPKDMNEVFIRGSDALEPYCSYGKSYFETGFAKLLWIHSWFQRTATSFGTIVVIAFILPPSRWRWKGCDTWLINDPQGNYCPTTWQNQQYAIFLVVNVCMFLPLITQSLWWHWTWTLSAGFAILRLGIAVGVTALSAKYVEGVAIVGGGDAEFDSLPADIRAQVSFIFTWFLFTNVIGGIIAIVAAIYSHVANWKRSQRLVAIDIVVTVVVFVEQLALLVSFDWLGRERTFFCNYHKVFEPSDFISELCDSLGRHYRYIDMAVSVSVSASTCFVHCLLRILQLTWKRCIPSEWVIATIADYHHEKGQQVC